MRRVQLEGAIVVWPIFTRRTVLGGCTCAQCNPFPPGQALLAEGRCVGGACSWSTKLRLRPLRKPGGRRACACSSAKCAIGSLTILSLGLFGSSLTGPGTGAQSLCRACIKMGDQCVHLIGLLSKRHVFSLPHSDSLCLAQAACYQPCSLPHKLFTAFMQRCPTLGCLGNDWQ